MAKKIQSNDGSDGITRTVNFPSKPPSMAQADAAKQRQSERNKTHAAPSDVADKFMLRLSQGMRDRIKLAADEAGRSMNTEIVRRLSQSLDRDTVEIATEAETEDLWRQIHQRDAKIREVEALAFERQQIFEQLLKERERNLRFLELGHRAERGLLFTQLNLFHAFLSKVILRGNVVPADIRRKADQLLENVNIAIDALPEESYLDAAAEKFKNTLDSLNKIIPDTSEVLGKSAKKKSAS